jgi:hypothetical protein
MLTLNFARRRTALCASAAAIAVGALLAPLAAGSAQAASSGDKPAGFWYGTDSNYIAIHGSAPYSEPAIGGSYGGYIGMVGNWANWQGCHGRVIWSKTDARRAATNLNTYHDGIGVGGYWFMAGPGVDPHFNGTSKEAVIWGQEQAAAALADISKLTPKLSYPVIILDVELPGDAPSYTPAPDNGWNAHYTSPCSGVVKREGVAAQVDRADFNGFADYLTAHSSYKAGVYSAPSIWADIFGTGKWASISNTYEWTYTADTASLSDLPDGWCLAGTSTCAQFFGGITRSSKYALMWQWSGGGGTYNGVGDFDQIDGNRTP